MKKELVFFWGLLKYNRKIILLFLVIAFLKSYFPALNVAWYIIAIVLTFVFIFRFITYNANTFRNNSIGKKVSLISPTTGERVRGEVMAWTNENNEFWVKTETGETIFVSIFNKEESNKLKLKFL